LQVKSAKAFVGLIFVGHRICQAFSDRFARFLLVAAQRQI